MARADWHGQYGKGEMAGVGWQGRNGRGGMAVVHDREPSQHKLGRNVWRK